MQFESKYRNGIASGAISLTFRRWKRPQAVAGNTYRTAAGRLVVDSVTTIEPEHISEGDAVRAGYASGAALRSELRSRGAEPIYRVEFHLAAGSDPRDELAADAALDASEVAELGRRLNKLDRLSPSGAWTFETLALIAAHPGTRAGDLAPRLGQELQAFKLNVRKLKNLGLTLSLDTGYRLSPRGEAFVAATSNPGREYSRKC